MNVMDRFYMLMLGCLIFGFVYASPVPDSCKACKDTENCEDELENCQVGCDNTCRKCMMACVKNQDSTDDVEIATKYDGFMQNFKCCFQKLTACINTANKRKNDSYETAIQTCSAQMMGCTTKGLTKKEYLRKAPLVLSGMLQQYGKCKLIQISQPWKCVLDYHKNTEHLLARDCLNKYVHCAQEKSEAKLGSCPSSSTLKSCLTGWTSCMKLEKCPVGPKFLTIAIKDVWGNCGESTPVISNIKCILRNLIHDGEQKLLYDQHIKAGCALAYCGDIEDMKENYKKCVIGVDDIGDDIAVDDIGVDDK